MSIIEVKNISKKYGKRKILNNISINIEEGEIYGLLGPSGCGKSTTVKIIAGILSPDEGSAYIKDKKMPDFKAMEKIGYMSQSAALYNTLSGYENLKFFGSLFKLKKKELNERINEVAKLVDLGNDLSKQVNAYSGGMKQRLSLAITLLSDPDIMILDEPTVGIDPLLRKKIWVRLNELKQKGKTIIITTHVMDEVSYCDRLSMIRNGKLLISGTPDEIQKFANKDSIEEAFIYFSTKEVLEGEEE